MNKIFTFSALLVSGAILGTIAGKLNNNDTLRLRRSNLSTNIKSVKNFIKKTEDDDLNQYFI